MQNNEAFRYLRCMNRFSAFRDYIHYYFSAKTRFGIHSPFVFDFVCSVLNKKTKAEEIKEIESLRAELKRNNERITVTDFGAGSQSKSDNERKIGDIAKGSLKSKKYASLLYRMVKYYKPRKMLELGTSLGITTCYLAKSDPSAEIITIEGCEKFSEIAKMNSEKIGLKNISFITGNFDDVLEGVVRKQKPDFIFFDGNHTQEATLRYFEMCLPYAGNESIFVFDDINWSEEMKVAWEKIRENNNLTVTIDLHFMGIVFFRKELSKENFVIRF